MANRERGEYRLVTPGAVYTLRLDVGMCCELEDRTEQDFDAIAEAVNRGRITELRLLLWASIQRYHAGHFHDPEAVAALIDETGLPIIRAVLAEFLRLNTNDDTEGGEGDKDTRPGSIWRRLYLDLRECGVPADVFWRLSLCELWRELAALRQRRQRERDQIVGQAWWIAMLVWQKKLPALDKLLSGERTPRSQTAQEQTDRLKAFAKAHNESLKPPRKAKTDGQR